MWRDCSGSIAAHFTIRDVKIGQMFWAEGILTCPNRKVTEESTVGKRKVSSVKLSHVTGTEE